MNVIAGGVGCEQLQPVVATAAAAVAAAAAAASAPRLCWRRSSYVHPSHGRSVTARCWRTARSEQPTDRSVELISSILNRRPTVPLLLLFLLLLLPLLLLLMLLQLLLLRTLPPLLLRP